MSASGLFLEFQEPLKPGTELHLALQLPAEVTHKPVTIHCVPALYRWWKNPAKSAWAR